MTGDARAENSFATLILIGYRDVKQLCLANEILRIPFQCQSWRKFVLAQLLAHFLLFCRVGDFIDSFMLHLLHDTFSY